MAVCPDALDDDDLPSDAGLVVPAQFFERHHELTGTQKLCLALLLEAFAVLHHRRASVRHDAFAWLASATWYTPRLSVDQCAAGLGVEVAVIVRCAEQTWRSRR